MNWIDVLVVTLIAGIVVLEVKRGFGRALFDLVAAVLAARLASMLLPALSSSIKLAEQSPANEARIYALSFLVIGGVLFFVGKLIYDSTLISADTFDPFLGGILGFGVGIALCHALMRIIALSAGPDVVPPVIADSMLGNELLTFDSYHRLLETLYHFDRTEPTI